MMDEEIRQALREVREMKQMCGNINMKLTNIVTQRGQDWKKKLEAEYQRGLEEGYERGLAEGKKAFDLLDAERDAEYQRGLEDAWEAARKVVLSPEEGGMSTPTLFEIFRRGSVQPVFRNYSASQVIEKLKAYEEKQKADDKIKVGDEVAFHHDDGRPDTVVVVTYIGQDGFIDGMDGRGTQYAHKNPTKWTKTGRHFDIASILKEMQND